jgi:Carboxypeptidase regulatory-like domain
MIGRLLALAIAVGAGCVVAPAWLSAQANSGEIDGVVTDAQGGVLPGASISAVHLESGYRLERLTDVSGRFFLAPLSVGRYDISITLSGFRSLTQRGVTVLIGQRIHLPLTLQIGQISDSITVTAEAPMLNAASAEVSDIIDNHHVERLPLNGRQFLQLAQLGEGVVVPPGGTRGAALQQGGSLPAVDGQRSGHNIYLLDGVKVTDEYFNNLAVSPSPDAIQEFKIQKTMYPPEFGGKASALINVVTRSGTNAYHGSVLEFFRHDRLDAHNFFDDPSKPVPPLRQHQFGASLGGPAGARMFFFANYEGQRLHRSLTQTFSVPSLALRRGDFSSVGAICDPLTRTISAACMPFTGNQIPTGRLNPVAVGLLSQVLSPTSAGEVQNLRAVNPETQEMNQVTVRIDRRVGDGGNLFGRFIAYGVNDVQPFGSSQLNETLVPGFGRVVTTRTRSLAVGQTHTFGTSALNEVRFGFLDVSGGQESQNQGVDFASATGLQGVTRDPRDVGYPQVAFAGAYSAIGDPTTFVSRRNRSAELYENLLLDRGDHRFKFGAYVFRLAFNPVNPQAARGAFTYTGQWSGNAFADFLLGYPTSAQVGIGRADEHGRTNWWHFYGQDDWRVRSNVTVNYGVRYEINGQMNDLDHRLSAIDVTVPGGRFVIASDDRGQISSAAQPLLAEIPTAYVTSKDAGWTPALLEPSYRRIAPRVGLAWSIPGRRDTVVTAGVGVFLNQWAYSVQQALAQTLPFFFAKSISAAADATTPPFRTETVLLAGANGSVGGSTMNHDYRTEYARNWTASVQRQLAANTTIEVAYLRSDVFGADSSTVLNVPEPGPGPIAARRPIPALSNITAIRWDGYSTYNALTLKIAQRMTRGLAFSASYSLSKAIDDASDPGATDTREQPAAGHAEHGRGARIGELRPSPSLHRKLYLHASWGLAGQRHRHAAIRRAVFRDAGHGPG